MSGWVGLQVEAVEGVGVGGEFEVGVKVGGVKVRLNLG